MKRFWRHAFVLASLCAVLLIVGCVGGSANKIYSLKLTILNGEADDLPVAGATVHVAGKSLTTKYSDAKGEVAFSNLSGKVEVSVEGAGFETYSGEFELTKNEDITIRLKLADNAMVVGDGSSLDQAIGDPAVATIFLEEDVAEGDEVVISRPLNISLSGKTLRRDVTYNFAEAGEFQINGPGYIDGNISVNAPLATVSNYAEVCGLVHVSALATETWNEHYGENELVIAAQNITINLFKGAANIHFAEEGGENDLAISGAVGLLIANSSVRVTGADKIARAVVNATGVVFDYPPGEIDGSVKPEILYPEPDAPKPVSGPQFVTLARQQRYYDFDRGEITDDPSQADIELSWIQFGNDYTNYLGGFVGTWFKVGALDYRSDDTYHYFRTLDESDWEARDPNDMGQVEVNDTILLKTKEGRCVKLFVIDSRGHWNHDHAPEVDFVYLFTDEIDLEPPVIESVTLMVEGREHSTKEITDVIEFVVSDLEEVLLILNLNEIAYDNRGLVQCTLFAPRPHVPWWSYAYPWYYNRPPLADRFGEGITLNEDGTLTLIPGDDELWRQWALESLFDDLGFHYCDLMGNALTELPFSKIIVELEH